MADTSMVDTNVVDTARGSSDTRPSVPWLALVLLVGGVVGWVSSTALLVERVRVLQDPQVTLACDISPFVSCGALFDRWQAALLGFPNPILGVAGFIAPIMVGLGLLAGARFASWFWRTVTVGMLGAWMFVTWLFTQSVFVIGVLCPYCLVVWAATIPLWWTTLAASLADGHWGAGAPRRLGAALRPFVLLLIAANYALVVIVIVVRFPVIFAL